MEIISTTSDRKYLRCYICVDKDTKYIKYKIHE